MSTAATSAFAATAGSSALTPTSAATDARLMTEPRPVRSISGRQARVTRNTPRVLMACRRSQSATGSS